jgi:cytochrome c-type biogenesis protein CcmH
MVMTGFLAIALVLACGILASVLRPLWRGAPAATAACGGLLLLSCAGLYWMLGTPAALDASARRSPATLQDAVGQLEAALRRDPDQVEGWRLLGRAYASERKLAQARDAYARAAALAPDQPDVLVDAAEASALADPQHRFDAKATAQLQQAVQRQPQHQRARWFLGIAQRQAGKPADAAATWEPLLAVVDAKTASPLRAQIDEARREAGLAPLPASAVPATTYSLQVKVALDPELAARLRLQAGASVFVIARVPGGSPMPVAVERRGVRELPFTASLDDSDGPMPTQKLSALQEVEVIARLSMSGNAMPQPGDLESAPQRVRLPATQPVELTIGAARR